MKIGIVPATVISQTPLQLDAMFYLGDPYELPIARSTKRLAEAKKRLAKLKQEQAELNAERERLGIKAEEFRR